MKTSIKTLTTICAVVISLTANAQHRSRGNEGNENHGNNNNNNAVASADRHGHHGNGGYYGNNGHHYGNYNHNNWGHSGISIQFGAFPFWGNGNGYNYYNYGNGYANNIRRAARNSIRQSANVIGNALDYSDWNDTYSPWLAKAIRHQQYAKQLYFWGDYAGALNHAERAGYLAWTTLNYFNDDLGYNDGYNGGNYPDPYSDPNNPYYRKNNTTVPNTNSNDDSDFGYRKSAANPSATEKSTEKKTAQGELKKSDLDTTLPESKVNDKELLKTSVKDLDVE